MGYRRMDIVVEYFRLTITTRKVENSAPFVLTQECVTAMDTSIDFPVYTWKTR